MIDRHIPKFISNRQHPFMAAKINWMKIFMKKICNRHFNAFCNDVHG